MASKRILIIEDSPTQSEVLASIVTSLGCQPIVHNSLSKGVVQILTEDTPDVVLLDLRLLDDDGNSIADGFQICREIKKSQPATPVIIVSSEDIGQAGEWARLQGADAFLQKPFVPGDLQKLLITVCPDLGAGTEKA